MKKIFSVLLSAALTFGSANVGIVPAGTANAADTDADIVVFGDSIAAGYTREGYVDYNYGDICADYLGGTATNYAVPGYTTDDLINVIEGLSDSQKETVKNAEYVFISIGGNDIIHYASSYVINYASKKNFFNEGYTAADIPENPTMDDLYSIVNLRGEGGVMDYVNSGINATMELGAELRTLAVNLRTSEIPSKIMPNIKTAVDDIKAVNPNAQIIIQTIYNPFEISKEYLTSRYGENSNYATMIGQVRLNINNVMTEFQKKLGEYAATDSNVQVADVFYQFKALGDTTANNANPGFTYYFTDMQQDDLKDADFHPNQKGHLAIAATYLDTIGILHDDNGLLAYVYDSLDDKENYPEIPLETLKKVAGNYSIAEYDLKLILNTMPAKSVYKIGESLDLSGATFDFICTPKDPSNNTDHSLYGIPVEKFAVDTSEYNSAKTGVYKITVSLPSDITNNYPFTEFPSVSFEVTVEDNAVTMLLGDVDGDGKITAMDASAVLTYYVSKDSPNAAQITLDLTAADYDQNGKIDAMDASAILTYYVTH